MNTPNVSVLRIARELAVRDIRGTYSRSVLGYAWIVITPVGMLAIYWLVFAFVLDVQWPGLSDSKVGYALPFFCGLIPYLAVADIISNATAQFESKKNLISKGAVPLYVIPLAAWIRSCIVAAPSVVLLIVLALFNVRALGLFSVQAFAALLALSIMTAGLAFLLSAVGAFFGDLRHSLQLILRVLFYSAPISYPLAQVPASIQPWLLWNPLTAVTEWLRAVVVYGTPTPLLYATISIIVASSTLLLGVFVFGRVQRVILDVI